MLSVANGVSNGTVSLAMLSVLFEAPFFFVVADSLVRF